MPSLKDLKEAKLKKKPEKEIDIELKDKLEIRMEAEAKEEKAPATILEAKTYQGPMLDKDKTVKVTVTSPGTESVHVYLPAVKFDEKVFKLTFVLREKSIVSFIRDGMQYKLEVS